MNWLGYPCIVRLLTGLYCFGCGGTRAVMALLKGQLLLSFFYHPIVLYGAAAVPSLFLYQIYCRKKERKMPQKLWQTVLYIGIAILIVNFLVKNYYLIFQHADLLAMLGKMP